MVSDLVVRVAGEGDVAAVASLRLAWGDGAHGRDPDFERHLAELAGEPVGMASLYEYRRMPRPGRMDSRWGYVGNMFVRAERRDRGIGSALLSAIIAAAHVRDYARLTVSPTPRSVPFYRRAGFVDADGDAAELLLTRPGHLA